MTEKKRPNPKEDQKTHPRRPTPNPSQGRGIICRRGGGCPPEYGTNYRLHGFTQIKILVIWEICGLFPFLGTRKGWWYPRIPCLPQKEGVSKWKHTIILSFWRPAGRKNLIFGRWDPSLTFRMTWLFDSTSAFWDTPTKYIFSPLGEG